MATKRQIDAGAEFLGTEDAQSIGEISGRAGIDVVDKPMPKEAFAVEAFIADRP